MKINAQIVISDGVMQNSVDGSTSIIQNPTLLIGLPFMPSGASFTISIVAGIISDQEIGELPLSLKVSNVDTSKEVFVIEESKIGPFPIKMNQSNLVLNTEIRNIPIELEGEYKVEIVLANKEFSQKFFIVKNKVSGN